MVKWLSTICLLIVIFDKQLCPANCQAETENERIETGTDRNGELRTETGYGEKRRIAERNSDARIGSEGREC